MLRVSRQRRQYVRATARVGRMSDARLILTVLALFAFTCQSYITQTHIHFRLASADAPITAELGGKAPTGKHDRKDPFRPNQDPVNCPICQKLVHAGPVVIPAAVFVPPTPPGYSLVALAEAARYFRAPSHIWQGRAPPRS